MKNTLRALSLVLLLCMIVSLAACGDTSDPGNTGSVNTGTSAPSTTGNGIVEEKEELEIPEGAYYADGDTPYEFRILGLNNGSYTHIDLTADEILEEPINDAVYERNSILEEKLGVKIVGTIDTPGNVLATARSNIQADNDAYDLYMPPMNSAVVLATEGHLVNLFEVPYLDLEKSWWDQNVNRDLIIKDKLYFTTGEISILDDDLTFIITFNKDALAEKLPDIDPYQMVKDYKWTVDNLLEIVKDLNEDTNSNGKMDETDSWGFMLNSNNSTIFYQAAGERIVKPDGEGGFKFGLDESRALAVTEKVLDFMLDNEFFRTDKMGSADTQLAKFMDGSVMFRATVFSVARQQRSMEMNFGILPNPMFDEEQKQYYTPASSQGYLPGVCIPSCASDLERTGVITEALAYYSSEYLTPAFYEASVKGVLTRDEESNEMLDIIFNTKVYDLGYIYNFASKGFILREFIQNESKNFASEFDRVKGSIESAISEVMDAFEF